MALKPSPPQTGRSQRGQPARAEPALQDRGDRRGDQLRDAGDQHDGADLEGVVAAHKGEKDRHQIDRAEQADAEAKAQGAADRKRAPLQCRELHNRMRRRRKRAMNKMPMPTALAANSNRCRSATASRVAALPSTRSRDRRGAAANSTSDTVELGKFGGSVFCRGSRNGVDRGRDQPRDDVDQKQPGPGLVLRDPAADDGADGRREHRDHAADRGGDRVKPGRKQQEYRGEHRGNQHAAGKTLHHAKRKQHGEAAAEGAADRGSGEERDADDEQPAQASARA